MTFEKWWEETFGYGDYGNPPNEAVGAWDAAWQAATPAERERCEAIVLAECMKDCNCPECSELKAVAAIIRKGEGV